MPNRLFTGCLVALLAGAILPRAHGQQPLGATEKQAPSHWTGPSPEPTRIHTAADDMGRSYGIWGCGRRYKMSFHDGATFVPMLGKDYPHNQPLQWRTVSATRGATELVTRAPSLSYAGTRAEYDLGGIVEAYDLRAIGAEQTFVIASARGHGDLLLRGHITSALTTANVAAAHQELAFLDADGRHLITYGAATAIDADGRRHPMTTTHHDGEITLRVAGSWLDSARFPIVIDPVLTSPHQIYTWSELVASCDVVRSSEGTLEPGWVGYATWASATDRDVFLRRIHDDVSIGSEVFADLTASWSTQRPKVAYVAGTGRAVMIFDRSILGGPRTVRTHDHHRNDLLPNSTVTQINTPHHAWRPDIGGTTVAGFDVIALAVWQAEPNTGPFQSTSSSKIYGAYLNLATGGHSAIFAIADASQHDQERPSVNQYATGTANNSWKVAYQTIEPGVLGGDDWDIEVRSIDNHYGVSPPTQIDAGSTDHQFAPTIEGLTSQYAIAYVTSPTSAAFPADDAGHEIRITRVVWPQGSATGYESYGTKVVQSNADPRLEIGGLGYDRESHSHWALMFRSNVTSNLYLRTFGFRGDQLRAETVWNGASIRGGVCYNHATDRYLLAHGRAAAWDYVIVDQYEYPSVAPWSTAGTGCSSAAIAWQGSQLIGSYYSGVVVNGADPNSIHLMVLATEPASVQLFGVPPIVDGCWLLVPNTGPDFLALLDFRVGTQGYWRLRLPEYLTNDDLYFQGFHTMGGALELHSTQRLQVPIVR